MNGPDLLWKVIVYIQYEYQVCSRARFLKLRWMTERDGAVIVREHCVFICLERGKGKH